MGPLLALAAAAALMLGSVLDWSGVDYSSRLDRTLAFAAGLFLVAVAALAMVWRPRALVLALLSGALGLNMAIVNINDIAGHKFEYAAYPAASVGIGLYFVLGGALIALVVGLVAVVPRK